jgi:hypothetical protein
MATSTLTPELEQAGVSIGAGCATGGPVGCGVAAAVTAVKLGITELTQHTARLGNATAENTAADECVPAFDADMQAIASAWRNGQASLSTCTTAMQIVINNCYAYLSSLVGKPGTAWSGSVALAQQGKVPCNTKCTVSCCIFYNDLYCAVYGCSQFGGYGKEGALAAINGKSSNGQQTTGGPVSGYYAYVPEIYPPDDSKYGNFTRAAYVLDFTPPKPGASALSGIQDTVAQLTASTTKLASSNATSAATASKLDTATIAQAASSNGLLSGSNTLVIVVAAVFLLLAIFLAVEA